MPPAARVSDMHTCPMVNPGPVPHVGGPVLPPCCPTVLIGFLPAARVSDQCLCAAGPPDIIIMGSPTVLIGNMMAARMGDPTAHGGVIVAGCPTVIIGEMGMGSPTAAAPGLVNSAPASAGQIGPLSSQSGSGSMQIAGNQQMAAPDGQASPGSRSNTPPPEKTWIGVQLTDFLENPVPNEPYRLTLDTGQVFSGTTDSQGLARHEGVNPDSGELVFPNVPQDHSEGAPQQFQGPEAADLNETSRSDGPRRLPVPELETQPLNGEAERNPEWSDEEDAESGE